MYDVLSELSLLSEVLQKREVTVVYAERLIRRCIRYLEAMKKHKGEKVAEVENAIKHMKYGAVVLTDNRKHKPLDHAQFLTSMVNNMQTRLFCQTPVLQGLSTATPKSSTVLSELAVLEVDNWPIEIPPGYGRQEIKSLCARFQLPQSRTVIAFEDYKENGGKRVQVDLTQLLTCAQVIACSSAECERGFSAMNSILTERRSRLLINRVSDLMFIKMHGPPVNDWKPERYVKTWLRCHRSAVDTQTKIAKAGQGQRENNGFWKFL